MRSSKAVFLAPTETGGTASRATWEQLEGGKEDAEKANAAAADVVFAAL